MAKMVDAVALDATSLTGLRVRVPPTALDPNLLERYVMPKKKVTPKRKPGPKPDVLKIDGPWTDAVKHALRRGKPPKDRAKP